MQYDRSRYTSTCRQLLNITNIPGIVYGFGTYVLARKKGNTKKNATKKREVSGRENELRLTPTPPRRAHITEGQHRTAPK